VELTKEGRDPEEVLRERLDGLAVMSRLVQRLAELRRHLAHLRELRPRVLGAQQLRGDLSLHNDVLFSLMQICQLVIDMASDIAARRGLRFEDYVADLVARESL
jgi:hypothetical protein